MRNKKSGFTLLELIIVVVVIGILASIALPRYIRIAEKGRIAEAKTILGTIRSAQLRYVAERGQFATAIANLDVNFQTPRYFIPSVPATSGDTSAESTIVAIMQRNTVDNPFNGWQYYINMSQNGGLVYDTNMSSMI